MTLCTTRGACHKEMDKYKVTFTNVIQHINNKDERIMTNPQEDKLVLTV